ncbi:MAG TPA: type II toxin-antitoxin system PemK/MazF family toxin [Gemmatimonadales bacterium]|nr:type II toxin-antitoxin system PemK/MazF family toxin [Gemmatimonadales bacterium]
MIERGAICWAEPQGPGPGARFPVLVVQADPFNRSRIPTVVVVPLVANLRLADAPGNVRLPAPALGLPHDLVANVAQVLTLERRQLRATGTRLGGELLDAVSGGLELVLGLDK